MGNWQKRIRQEEEKNRIEKIREEDDNARRHREREKNHAASVAAKETAINKKKELTMGLLFKINAQQLLISIRGEIWGGMGDIVLESSKESPNMTYALRYKYRKREREEFWIHTLGGGLS